jgi:3',5'-cyclic-AMP phosphodiesterase
MELHFAQISDIHISVLGNHHDLLSGQTPDLLRRTVAQLNQFDDLDFVLITGDLLDTAHPEELVRFQEIIGLLNRPYYVIPGNHDLSSDGDRLSRLQFARRFNPQLEARPAGDGQLGYWSVAVGPEVQLIGLDSVRTEDWGGVIDAAQLAWLENELAGLNQKGVILAVHHPLHQLAPIDTHPDWTNFVCDNGPQLLALLDRYPQVKLVLTGHHHLTRADRVGGRLHLACPALAGYPCAYRDLRLARQSADAWRIDWRTYAAAEETTLVEARELLINGWQSVGFEAAFVEQYAGLALGSQQDRHSSVIL